MKIIWKTLVIAGVFVLLTGLVAACGGFTAAGPNMVHMGDHAFPQNTITIKKGESITLTNDGTAQHIIANGTWDNNEAIPGAEPGAPKVDYTIAGGASQIIGPFNTAGIFKLYCTVHPGMRLDVIVH